jgi:Fis family transcriptional regulator
MKMTTPHARNLQTSLSETVDTVMREYLDVLGEHEASNIYRLVMDEVERPLMDVMMEYTRGNQSKAAKYLGINRATLRTKLKRYDLI